MKCLMDNEDVAFAFAKFGASLDVHFLASDAFKVGVINVGGPTRQVVEFCEKENSADTTKENNARACTLKRDLSEMTASHKTSFVTAVMLDVMCEMAADLLMAFKNNDSVFETTIDECIAFINLKEFKDSEITSPSGTELLIQCKSMLTVLENLKTALVFERSTMRAKLGLIGKTEQFLLMLDNATKAFSPVSFEWVVLAGTHSTFHGRVSAEFTERLRGTLLILSFDEEIAGTASTQEIARFEGTLMKDNTAKLSH